MASSIDFVQYIVDQCSGAGEITAKKMFGDRVSFVFLHIYSLFAVVISSPSKLEGGRGSVYAS